MTNRAIFSLLLLSISIMSVTCKKSSSACQWAAEPPVFFFQIKKNGLPLPDSILSGLKLSYTFNGTQKNIPDLSQATDSYANKGILTSREIGTFENQIFYLEYSDGLSTDTLFVSDVLPSPATNCQYKTTQIKFDDLIIVGDTTFGYQPVYVFNKP